MEKYIFREYDPRYPSLYQAERRKIARALGAEGVVEHVGSTAVPELGGKGILDILVGVPRDQWDVARRALQRAGYRWRAKASTPQRYFLRRDYPYEEGTRRVHVHLTSRGSWDWRRHIAFRNLLRRRPDIALEYAETKREAAALAKGDGTVYNAHKAEFIARATRKTQKQQRR